MAPAAGDDAPEAPDAQLSTERAIRYWSAVPATVDGMLGGYPQVSRIDLRGSLIFVAKLRNAAKASGPPSPLLERGADCGAGIGRVTAGLMSRVCGEVDLVEPMARFAAQAQQLPDHELGPGRIGKVYVCGLEDWHPDEARLYDLIWHQWCLDHLTNAALDAYLRRCQRALRPGGWIVVKENISPTEDRYLDEDNTLTRTDASYRAVFEKAGLTVVRSELQRGFPAALGLYRVRFYALQPTKPAPSK